MTMEALILHNKEVTGTEITPITFLPLYVTLTQTGSVSG